MFSTGKPAPVRGAVDNYDFSTAPCVQQNPGVTMDMGTYPQSTGPTTTTTNLDN